MVRVALLWCRKSPEGHEFKAGLHHPMTVKLSLSTIFESGKDKAAKGEGWAATSICCALHIVGL